MTVFDLPCRPFPSSGRFDTMARCIITFIDAREFTKRLVLQIEHHGVLNQFDVQYPVRKDPCVRFTRDTRISGHFTLGRVILRGNRHQIV